MKNQQMVEVDLAAGTARMRTKVPYSPLLKVGHQLRLLGTENPDTWWVIRWMGDPFSSDILKRGWNNNI